MIVGQESADESPYFRIYFNENGTFTVEDHSEGPVPLDGDLELADIGNATASMFKSFCTVTEDVVFQMPTASQK